MKEKKNQYFLKSLAYTSLYTSIILHRTVSICSNILASSILTFRLSCMQYYYCSSIKVENEIAKSFFYSHQKVRVVGAGTDMFFMAMNVAGFFPGGGAHRRYHSLPLIGISMCFCTTHSMYNSDDELFYFNFDCFLKIKVEISKNFG